jgi:hypothetical protein
VTETTAALAATRLDAIVVEAADGPGQAALLLQLVRFALPATAARARVILLLETEFRSAYLDAAAWGLIGNETASAVVEALPIIQKEMEIPTALDVGAKYQVLNEDRTQRLF